MSKLTNQNYLDYHRCLCEKLHETYVKKNADYGNSFHKSIEQWGMAAAGVRISDKYNRLMNLLQNPDKAKVKDESVKDTCLDLANYLLMLHMEINND